MMLAAANGDLSMVKLLIMNNAKIEKPDKYKRTALTLLSLMELPT